ncbi:MAG: bifunctional riboflavin kinase/FAD synthetase [bacterium]
MNVYRDIKDLARDCSAPVVTVGTFDGIHLGHRKVIACLLRRAGKRGAPSALITFDPHPKAVVDGSTEPFVLTTVEEKADIVEAEGVGFMLASKFDLPFAKTKPKDFIVEFLVERLNIQEIVVGYDHHFGFHRRGDISLLRDEGKRLSFDVEVVPPALLDGLPVSSTRIRRVLRKGDIPLANRMLGRPYSLSGQVVEGASRGVKLGFRTANVLVNSPRKLIPGNGVYAVMARVDKNMYEAVMNIGSAPTFKGKESSLEVHIMNFAEEIYGKSITIEFHRRMRDEIAFAGGGELASQIGRDIEEARRILSRISGKNVG